MMMGSLKDEILPFTAMVMVEIAEVGMVTLSKAALTTGMSNSVFVVYYNSLGTFILFLYFLFQSHRSRRPLTFTLLCRFFLIGLLGIFLVQNLSLIGIKYSSPTLATAMGNLIPGFTFLLAVTFRMEKLARSRRSSQAKIIGTIVSITGAFIVTLYKGQPIVKVSSFNNSSFELPLLQKSNWVLGGLFFTFTCLSSATWSIVQAATLKEYPEKMTLVFFSCLFGTIQCAVFSLIAERNINAWILNSGIQVIATIYSAIFVTAFRSSIIAWCLQKKGPVYVALFKPLSTAIAVVMAMMFLGETPHLGGLIGAAIIALGFYTVMWGKAKEKDITAGNMCSLESSTEHTPLIQSN
ncbi:WAT1-related protein [Quillaja saponaria]|uniref:WAT1-related protein n=1 Tax=Quillaja saponaria TaxID=32244 RepID=A0AAD7Q4C1_QUISA|nr:WAT1-related protein [Quillaja saponaria]